MGNILFTPVRQVETCVADIQMCPERLLFLNLPKDEFTKKHPKIIPFL